VVRIRSVEKSNDIGNQTCDLPDGSIVLQPTRLPCAPTDVWSTGETHLFTINAQPTTVREVVVI
jgi:hypothetical protein